MEESVITICMGSSCFARGNEENLRVIEAFLRQRGLEGTIRLRGSRCEGYCAMGPNVRIGEKYFHKVRPDMLEKILEEFFPEKERGGE